MPVQAESRLLKNAQLRCCVSSFVIATYNLKVTRKKIRLIPQDLRTLHLSIFEQPESDDVDYG